LLPAGAFAGWNLDPPESAAFSRRTQIAAIRNSDAEYCSVRGSVWRFDRCDDFGWP
jgi:hypothetical protein